MEPYFGSGAMLFNKSMSAIETVNDLDGDVVNLFRCIQQDSERLARLVMTTPFSREVYEQQFEGTEQTRYASRYQRAAGFLIKCWQGYGFRTNGYKVGWKNDVHSREQAYAIWNWYRLPSWIIDVAERLRMVQIEHRPALEVIKRFCYDNVFMYLDPPYLLDTRHGKQYKNEMTDADHEAMLKVILQSPAKIMISGYESEMYNDYLHSWDKKRYAGTTESGKSKTEIVWMNYKLESQISLFDMMQEKENGSGTEIY